MGIANEAPLADLVGMPLLTVRMAACFQGLPDNWEFAGGETQSYRRVGNALPPPFARAVAEKLRECLMARRMVRKAG